MFLFVQFYQWLSRNVKFSYFSIKSILFFLSEFELWKYCQSKIYNKMNKKTYVACMRTWEKTVFSMSNQYLNGVFPTCTHLISENRMSERNDNTI